MTLSFPVIKLHAQNSNCNSSVNQFGGGHSPEFSAQVDNVDRQGKQIYIHKKLENLEICMYYEGKK